MRSLVRLGIGVAVVVVAGGAGVNACGGGDAGPAPTAGMDGGAARDGDRTDANAHDSGSADAPFEGYPCTLPPRPAGVPDSWTAMTDWYCDCPIYYSTEREALPHFKWSPCDLSTLSDGGGGLQCEELSIDVPGDVFVIGGLRWDGIVPSHPRLGVGVVDHASATLDQTWFFAGGPDDVADIGLTTIASASPGECTVIAASGGILNGTFAIAINGHRNSKRPIGVVYLGADGGLHVAHRSAQADEYDVSGGYGDLYVGKTPGLATYLITDAGTLQQIDPIPGQGDGLTGGIAIPFPGGTFLQRYSGILRAIDTWTVAGGHKPFLHAPNPWQKGYGSFGTDGKDIVWSEGSGPPPAGGDPDTFSVRELYTSPYTTDPAKLVPRHLRSEPDQYQGRSAVGCGYMVKGFDAAQQHPAIVVRLSDGRAWLIPSSVPGTPPLSSVSFASAPATYGVTCDHIYIEAAVGAYLTVFRFRIDSLGPGYPVGEDPPGW